MNRILLALLAALPCALLLTAPATAQEPPQPTVIGFEEALQLALAGPDVSMAEGGLALAERQLEIASSVVSAELSAGYTQTWGELTDPVSADPTSLDDGAFDPITLRANFNLVPYGPNADAVQRAVWSLERAAGALDDARTGAILGAAGEYLTALRSAQEAGVAAADVALAETRLEATRTRLEVGAANDAQLLQAEIELSRAQSDLAEIEREGLQALALLSQRLGLQVVAVEGEPPAPPYTLVVEEDESLLANRSDVRSALIAILEVELERAGTLRDFLPSGRVDLGYSSSDGEQAFALGAGFDTRSYQPTVSATYDPSPSSAAESRSVSVSLSVTVPLETSTPAALAAAALSVEQRRLQAEQTLELARLELAGRRNELAATRARLELTRRLVEQTRMAFDAARERFDLGTIAVLDVRQAELDLLEADLQNRRAQDDVLLATLRLAQTLATDPLEVVE